MERSIYMISRIPCSFHGRGYLYVYRLLKLFGIIAFIFLCLSCGGPDSVLPTSVPCRLRLHYETDFPIWDQDYTLQDGVTSKNEVYTKSVMGSGRMRYVIRVYPISGKARSTADFIHEFVYTGDLSDGYDREYTVDIAPGAYRIMVWSDMTESSGDLSFYDCNDFSSISLSGDYRGNVEYRDAFRGVAEISVDAAASEQERGVTVISMERPLAKYEFVTTDLNDFLSKEQTRVEAKGETDSKGAETKVTLDDYQVVFHYPEYMPDKYSIFMDKPVDSATGMQFNSKITQISDTEASVGFDYVFVDPDEGSIMVQIGIYDKNGKQLSMTKPIEVPLKRSVHSVLRGSFLMQKAPYGITINPDFDGDFNIFI